MIIDLSHPISDGMVTYPGLPGPKLSDHLSRTKSIGMYAPGVTFQIGRIDMIANTGTYVDSPFHRYEDGDDLAGLDLNRLVEVPGVLVDVSASDRRSVDVSDLENFEVNGRAVLIRTGWDRMWGTPGYGQEAPFVSADATDWLVANSPAVVGIDSVNIDDPDDPVRPAHSGLLGAGIPIVEHLCRLAELPADGFRFTAVPAPVRAFGSFPVRAVAVVE